MISDIQLSFNKLSSNFCDCEECNQRQVAFNTNVKYQHIQYISMIGFIEYRFIDKPYDTNKYYMYRVRHEECIFSKYDLSLIPIVSDYLISIVKNHNSNVSHDPNLYEDAKNYFDYIKSREHFYFNQISLPVDIKQRIAFFI